MPVYTVHAPLALLGRPRSMSDRFVFVRDGFHLWAFLLGPLWLAYRGLWLALTGYLVLNFAVAAALYATNAQAGTRFGVMLLIALLMGLEAASLWRWTLSRGKWQQLDIIVADDGEAAERRFFDRWTNQQRNLNGYQPPVDPGEPPPLRRIPVPSSSLYTDVVGSFPRLGSSR